MRDNLPKKILQKEMTRKEFLQFAGSSMLVLFGLTNFLALMSHLSKAEQPALTTTDNEAHGFGSRKFGA